MTRGIVVGCCWLLVLATGCVSLIGGSGQTYNGTVVDVVDGDTVVVSLDNGSERTVRLLGVDAPEIRGQSSPGEFAGVPNTRDGRRCLRAAGETASATLRERVAGAPVRLETDPLADRRGDYGRLLAYVVRGERNLNYALVAGGHARVYRTAFRERIRFEQSMAAARSADRGLWTCRNPVPGIQPEGYPDQIIAKASK